MSTYEGTVMSPYEGTVMSTYEGTVMNTYEGTVMNIYDGTVISIYEDTVTSTMMAVMNTYEGEQRELLTGIVIFCSYLNLACPRSTFCASNTALENTNSCFSFSCFMTTFGSKTRNDPWYKSGNVRDC